MTQCFFTSNDIFNRPFHEKKSTIKSTFWVKWLLTPNPWRKAYHLVQRKALIVIIHLVRTQNFPKNLHFFLSMYVCVARGKICWFFEIVWVHTKWVWTKWTKWTRWTKGTIYKGKGVFRNLKTSIKPLTIFVKKTHQRYKTRLKALKIPLRN